MKYPAAVFLLCLTGLGAGAQSPLKDPGLPDGERLVYRTQEGEKIFQTRMEIQRSADAGVLTLVSESPELRMEVVMDAPGFRPRKNTSWQKHLQSAYRTETQLEQAPPLGRGEILVLKTSELPFLLRGYPFDRPETLGVVILGNPRDSGFRLEVQYRGQEDVTVQGRPRKAHKLELVTHLSGAMAFFGGMIPKVYFWYSTSAPHLLLKYQGSSGFGGSKPLTMELQ